MAALTISGPTGSGKSLFAKSAAIHRSAGEDPSADGKGKLFFDYDGTDVFSNIDFKLEYPGYNAVPLHLMNSHYLGAPNDKWPTLKTTEGCIIIADEAQDEGFGCQYSSRIPDHQRKVLNWNRQFEIDLMALTQGVDSLNNVLRRVSKHFYEIIIMHENRGYSYEDIESFTWEVQYFSNYKRWLDFIENGRTSGFGELMEFTFPGNIYNLSEQFQLSDSFHGAASIKIASLEEVIAFNRKELKPIKRDKPTYGKLYTEFFDTKALDNTAALEHYFTAPIIGGGTPPGYYD